MVVDPEGPGCRGHVGENGVDVDGVDREGQHMRGCGGEAVVVGARREDAQQHHDTHIYCLFLHAYITLERS